MKSDILQLICPVASDGFVSSDGFAETVVNAWTKRLRETNAIRALHIKISRVTKALKKWNREIVARRRFRTVLANEVIFQLDTAQENRVLTEQEKWLRG